MQIRFYICFVFLLVACQPQPRLPESNIRSYLPIQEGGVIEFEVVRTNYSLSSPPETKKYIIRHTLGTTLRDQSNQMIIPISYLTLNNLTWRTDSVGAILSTFDRILGSENGQTIVKLAEPLAERNFWNGNAYNKLGEQIFRLMDVGVPRQVGKFYFPKTITVIRQNDSSLLSRKKYVETYAEGIGLVHREIQMLSYCYSIDCKGKGIVKGGVKEISTLKNHEK